MARFTAMSNLGNGQGPAAKFPDVIDIQKGCFVATFWVHLTVIFFPLITTIESVADVGGDGHWRGGLFETSGRRLCALWIQALVEFLSCWVFSGPCR